MGDFFALQPAHPFVLFGSSHLVTLFVMFLILLWFYVARKKLQKPALNRFIRILLLLILVISEIAGFLWLYEEHVFRVADSLPLQLCDISLMLCIVMLLLNRKSYPVYEIVYFIGVGGAGVALLTPDLLYDFPQFGFFDFFLTHFGIVLACLFMTWTGRLRPRYASVWKTMLFLNFYMLLILRINHLLHGNYLYLTYKPEHASLMDYLGPYPWYIFALEGVAVFLFHLLYLPFYLHDRKRKIGKNNCH